MKWRLLTWPRYSVCLFVFFWRTDNLLIATFDFWEWSVIEEMLVTFPWPAFLFSLSSWWGWGYREGFFFLLNHDHSLSVNYHGCVDWPHRLYHTELQLQSHPTTEGTLEALKKSSTSVRAKRVRVTEAPLPVLSTNGQTFRVILPSEWAHCFAWFNFLMGGVTWRPGVVRGLSDPSTPPPPARLLCPP